MTITMTRPAEKNITPETTAAGAEHIVFFDGVCGFCNAWVDFWIQRDPQNRLKFAPLQGETARMRLNVADVENLNSLVFSTPRGVYRKTSAVVRIGWTLGGVWSVLATMLWLIPRPLRDVGYAFIAHNRYRFFGKKETCRLPTPAERARFLD